MASGIKYKNYRDGKTYTVTSSIENPTVSVKGVDDSVTEKAYNSTFTASDKQQNAQSKAEGGLNRVEQLTSKDKLISDSVWDTLNKSFTKPTAVKEADKWLSSQLQKIQSGRTSYSEQVEEMMSQIMGREKFSYDVDSDPLFQQALASAMNSGKQAMQDTMGQASALTGGYGSTYATSAANQAYNAFIEDAYDNLPQYYQMAMEAYQMEGDEMYRQLGMLTDADDREYSRNVTAYDATYQHRNQMYNEAYTQFRDAKTDAYNTANLKLSEHGQLVSDAVNYYNSASDYANTMYDREYTQWADEVEQAMKYAEMLNSDWWKQTEFDEDVRQYEKDFAEKQRQYEKDYAQKDEHFNKNLEFTATENQKDREWKTSESQLDRSHDSSENALDRGHDTDMQNDRQSHESSENALDRQHDSSENALDRGHDKAMQDDSQSFTAEENAKYKNGNDSGDDEYSTLTNTEYNAVTTVYTEAGGGDKGLQAVDAYLETIGKNNLSAEATEALKANLDGISVPVENQGWTLTTDTKNGGFLWWKGDDHDDVYTDANGNTKTYDELCELIDKSDLSDARKKELKNYYKSLSKK